MAETELGSMQDVREQIKMLFEEGERFKKEGRHIDALKKFDECQQVIKRELGENSDQLPGVYNEIAIVCNVLSMAHLQKEDYKLCQDLLKKAELFTEGNQRLRAITYNNYACLFRKTNKLRNALTYLEMALELEYHCLNASDAEVSETLMISNPCEIHLNICAILSQLNKHELALHHAMKALILIQDELLEIDTKGQSGESRQTVMIIALHNIAVEYEYLKQYQSSLLTYQKARDFAFKFLGPEHVFSQKMDRVLQDSATKIKGILERQNKRVMQKYGNPSSVSARAQNTGNTTHRSQMTSGGHGVSDQDNDLSQLLESGLNLDNGPGAVQKASVGKNYPRQNRSPPRRAFK